MVDIYFKVDTSGEIFLKTKFETMKMFVSGCLHDHSSIREHPFSVHIRANVDCLFNFCEISCLVAILYNERICPESSLWRRISKQSTLICCCWVVF